MYLQVHQDIDFEDFQQVLLYQIRNLAFEALQDLASLPPGDYVVRVYSSVTSEFDVPFTVASDGLEEQIEYILDESTAPELALKRFHRAATKIYDNLSRFNVETGFQVAVSIIKPEVSIAKSRGCIAVIKHKS